MDGQYDIFISYSRRDYKTVKQIKSEIDSYLGVECWMDLTGIESGHPDFADEIIAAINKCNVFIFIQSKHSMRSKWATREIDFAKEQGKKVVLVRVDKARQVDKFKFKYGEYDTIDYQNYLQRERLMRDLRKWLDIKTSDYTVSKVEQIRLHFRNSWWMYLVILAVIVFSLLFIRHVLINPNKTAVAVPTVNDSVIEDIENQVNDVLLETAMTSEKMAFDSVPLWTKTLNQVVNSFSSDPIKRLQQIEDAIKIQDRIKTISDVWGIPFQENEKLTKQILLDFNEWVKAGDGNPVVSVKIDCYETALRIKDDIETRNKLNQLKE